MSNTENKSPEVAPNNETNGAEVNAVPVITRRRLFRAGLTAAPVAMTLASRPVLAWHCTTPSAFGSIDRSRKLDCTTVDFHTFTCDEWKSKCNSFVSSSNRGSWPSACPNPKTTKFSNCLSGTKLGTTATINDVLNKTGAGAGCDNFDQILLAAYLNCVAGVIDPILCLPKDGSKVKAMYIGGIGAGYYPAAPAQTPKWVKTDIERYLAQNWIAVKTSWPGGWNAMQCK